MAEDMNAFIDKKLAQIAHYQGIKKKAELVLGQIHEEAGIKEAFGPYTRAYRLLNQDEIWVDSSAKPYLIEEMSPGHRYNLLRWLEREAVALARSYSLFALWEKASTAGLPVKSVVTSMNISGDHLVFDVESLSPDETLLWLQQTPLYVRLRAEVSGDTGHLFP